MTPAGTSTSLTSRMNGMTTHTSVSLSKNCTSRVTKCRIVHPLTGNPDTKESNNFEKRVKKCLKLLKGKRRIISVWRFRFSCVPRNAGSRFCRGQCRLASREPALREVRLLGDGMPWRVVARLSGPDEMVFFLKRAAYSRLEHAFPSWSVPASVARACVTGGTSPQWSQG